MSEHASPSLAVLKASVCTVDSTSIVKERQNCILISRLAIHAVVW